MLETFITNKPPLFVDIDHYDALEMIRCCECNEPVYLNQEELENFNEAVPFWCYDCTVKHLGKRYFSPDYKFYLYSPVKGFILIKRQLS